VPFGQGLERLNAAVAADGNHSAKFETAYCAGSDLGLNTARWFGRKWRGLTSAETAIVAPASKH
jgi:hypothetical protein